MDFFRSRHTETFSRGKHSTSLHSTTQLSVNTLPAKEKLSPLILPIFPSLVIRHLGLVTFGPAVQGIISVDWYSGYLISRKDQLQKISNLVVADAFFSKETFITPMCKNGFHVISRFRNDAALYYPAPETKTGKRGHPKWYDGKIDFANLDPTRCIEYEVNKGKLYGLRVYAKGSKYRFPYPLASHSYTMLICLNDLFACLGLLQTRKLLTNFSKNLFILLPKPLSIG